MLLGKNIGAFPAKTAWRETDVRDGIQANIPCSRNRKLGCFRESVFRTTIHWSIASPSITIRAIFKFLFSLIWQARKRGRWCSMTGGTGGKLTSPAYRLRSHLVNAESTSARKIPYLLFMSPGIVSDISVDRQTNSPHPLAKCIHSVYLASSPGIDVCKLSISPSRRRDRSSSGAFIMPISAQLVERTAACSLATGCISPSTKRLLT